MSEYDELIERCCELLDAAASAERQRIESNFGIGLLLSRSLDGDTYGRGIVKKLADDLTRKRGRLIHPQRLYECLGVYRTFGGEMTRIWQLDREQGEITWGYLVRNCMREPTIEDDGEDAVSSYWEAKLNGLEKSLQAAEQIAEGIDTLPGEIRNQVRGFAEAVKQNNIASFNSSEKTALIERLKSLIDADEVTGQRLSDKAAAYIERVDVITLDNVVIVSPETEAKIKRCEVKTKKLYRIANKRNARLLEGFLTGERVFK